MNHNFSLSIYFGKVLCVWAYHVSLYTALNELFLAEPLNTEQHSYNHSNKQYAPYCHIKVNKMLEYFSVRVYP